MSSSKPQHQSFVGIHHQPVAAHLGINTHDARDELLVDADVARTPEYHRHITVWLNQHWR